MSIISLLLFFFGCFLHIAPFFEKPFHNTGTFHLQDSSGQLRLMIQCRISRDIEHRFAGPGLCIGTTINNPVHTTHNDCPGAHRAGLDALGVLQVEPEGEHGRTDGKEEQSEDAEGEAREHRLMKRQGKAKESFLSA